MLCNQAQETTITTRADKQPPRNAALRKFPAWPLQRWLRLLQISFKHSLNRLNLMLFIKTNTSSAIWASNEQFSKLFCEMLAWYYPDEGLTSVHYLMLVSKVG